VRRLGAAAAALVLVVAGIVLAVGYGPAVAAPSNQLSRGQQLRAGQSLSSEFGGGFQLILQTDGNVVEYLVSARRAVWATKTSGHGETLRFQNDGNVVLYSAANRPLWQTRTAGSAAVSFGVNVNGALFAATTRHLLWSSPPKLPANDIAVSRLDSANGRYRALMNTDGNFVVYSTHSGALWSTHTAGHPGSYLVVQQNDGNVVLYNSRNHALWSTGTAGKSNVSLLMQDDGNLVLYAGPVDHSVAVWSSKAAASRTATPGSAVNTAGPPTTTAAAPATCHPLTNSGHCYEPGEFCRNSDHGVTGVAGNGETILCEDNNGWRWEPV
jgi:hypothetical protein